VVTSRPVVAQHLRDLAWLRRVRDRMAKSTYGFILLATKDVDGTFEKLQADGAEVVQEPTDQPYGVRDCAFRDPAGNHVRIQELR
jgi:uncharacterized glyoxalase superfamily protein PhnB